MNFVLFLNSRPADDRQALRAKQEGRPSLISRRLVGHESYRVQQDRICRIETTNHLVVLRNPRGRFPSFPAQQFLRCRAQNEGKARQALGLIENHVGSSSRPTSLYWSQHPRQKSALQ